MELHGFPPHRVTRPIMRQQWRSLAYAHWPYPPDLVQSRLPAGLEVDTFDGQAWVGLVPFRMVGIAPPVGPPIPYFGTFPETNVRTYVVGADGPGVWFDSLDITRLAPVLVARTTYRLPYVWSKMGIEKTGNRITYTASRRWPGPRGARSRLEITVGGAIDEAGAFDHFLSARWRLYTMLGKRLAVGRVEHEPWPLHHARGEVDDEFVTAAGYPRPAGEPHVLYSPGVTVRVDRPRFV